MVNPLLNAPAKQGPAERRIELRISEYKAHMAHKIDVKFAPSELAEAKPEIKARLMREFETLVDAVFR